MPFGSTPWPLYFDVLVECHLGYSTGVFLSLTQEKKEFIMPNVLCADYFNEAQCVYVSHVRSCEAVCVGVSMCLPVTRCVCLFCFVDIWH